MESWEERKIESQGEHLRAKLIELEARGKHYDAEFTRINNSILGLNSKMDSGFDTLSKKLDVQAQQGKITWPLIFTAVGTLVGLFSVGVLLVTGALKPVAAQIEANRVLLERVEKTAAERSNNAQLNATSALQNSEEKSGLVYERIYSELGEQMDRNVRIWENLSEIDDRIDSFEKEFYEFKGKAGADSARYEDWIRSVESEISK